MSLSIDDLQKTATADETLDSWIAYLETLGVPASSWRKGGALRTILRVLAIAYAAWTVVLVAFVRSGFLETATGGWLTLLARNVYGVERVSATQATGFITLTNTGGGVYAQAAGTVVVRNPDTLKEYINADAIALAGGGTQTGVAFVAREAGSSSSAGPGEITELVTVLAGVTVTNPAAFVGLDEQTDADLRLVCSAKLAALSNKGPRSAYFYAVKSALRVDGSPVDINRVWVSPSSSTGLVRVVCASPSGTPVADDLTAARDNCELLARADTATLDLDGATPVALARSLTVWAKAEEGLDEAAIEDAVLDALAVWISTYPIGGIAKPPSSQGYLYASGVDGTAKAAHPNIFAVDGTGADLPLATGEVATLTATVTVRLVDTGAG